MSRGWEGEGDPWPHIQPRFIRPWVYPIKVVHSLVEHQDVVRGLRKRENGLECELVGGLVGVIFIV